MVTSLPLGLDLARDGEVGSGPWLFRYPLALGRGDTTRLPGQGEARHRGTPSLGGRQPPEHRSHQEADGAGPGRLSRTLGGAPALRRPSAPGCPLPESAVASEPRSFRCEARRAKGRGASEPERGGDVGT